MGWVGRKRHISKPYKSTQPNLPVGAGRGRWVLERSSVCESEGESYVMQIRLGTFVRFWYVALWASHMYPRGIQHVRSAYVIITIHSVCCVCMCLLCEKKRLRDFEQWQLHCLICIVSNCERSFLSFVYDCGNLLSWRLCLYDSYQLPVIAFRLLGIDWNMIDLKQFFWGFPTAASDLNALIAKLGMCCG